MKESDWKIFKKIKEDAMSFTCAKTSMFMTIKHLFLIFVAPFCFGADNPFIGEWSFDGNKTLTELKKNPKAPENVLQCYEKKLCGNNIDFIFSDSTWIQIVTLNGKVHPVRPSEL